MVLSNDSIKDYLIFSQNQEVVALKIKIKRINVGDFYDVE